MCSCHGGRPLGIEISTHRENLKLTQVEDTQDSKCSQIEIVLRSFTIDMGGALPEGVASGARNAGDQNYT